MKVKIGDKLYDSEKEPIMLIFDNDASRMQHAKNLAGFPAKEGERKYCVSPKGTPEIEIRQFMGETDTDTPLIR